MHRRSTTDVMFPKGRVLQQTRGMKVCRSKMEFMFERARGRCKSEVAKSRGSQGR